FALGQLIVSLWPEEPLITHPAAVKSRAESPQPAPGVPQVSAAVPKWLAPVTAFVEPHVPGLRMRSDDLWFFLGAATVLMALGLLDDFRGVDWRLRLVVQTIVAAAVVFGRGWQF